MSELLENWEQKVEEITALESIYGSDFSLLGIEGLSSYDATPDVSTLSEISMPPDNSILECQVMIPVDTPPEGISLGIDIGGGSDCPPVRDLAGKVHHLPPLSLVISMPAEYPQSKAPSFALSGIWLSEAAKGSVHKLLEALWVENGPGVPICFAWIEALKSTLLESIGASEQLMITNVHQEQGEGPSSGCQVEIVPPETVLVHILRYNAVCKQQVFRRGTWTCQICMEEKLGEKFTMMPTCNHSFCSDCFSEYCRVNVQDGEVELTCLGYKCQTPIEPHILKGAVNEEDYQRWETLLLQRTLDKMKDVRYCPRCNFVCVEDPGYFAQCEKCYFAFCTKCYESWHPGSDCISPMEDEPTLGVVTSDQLRRKRKDLANQSLSRAAIKLFSKPCPGCAMAIERSEGCNKMKCTYCYTAFCFKCGEIIEDYSHFWDGNCILFDEQEIRRWEAMQAGPHEGAAAQVFERRVMRDLLMEEGRENRVQLRHSRCPYCGQQNIKDSNNNHMKCWACSLGYCYLCRTRLGKKIGSHFSQGPCKQHSDD